MLWVEWWNTNHCSRLQPELGCSAVRMGESAIYQGFRGQVRERLRRLQSNRGLLQTERDFFCDKSRRFRMLKPVGIIFSERRAPESRSPSSGIPHLVKPGIERGSNPYHFLVVRVEGDQLDRVIDLDIFPVSRSGPGLPIPARLTASM